MKQSHCLVYSSWLRYAQVKWSVSDAAHVVMLSLIPAEEYSLLLR